METMKIEREREAVPHLFATGERNNDGFLVESIIIQRDKEGRESEEYTERQRKAERECVVCSRAPMKRV